ncbi:hypothetical protein RB195_016843 [Necator americanus]|uniref:Uncharacterized protein n=1 Tax=Necator americanus TaxID=51031 RepID=A0ABR1C5M6_NECAM
MGLILQNNLTAREFYPSGQALALIALPRHQRSGCPEIRRDSLSNANKILVTSIHISEEDSLYAPWKA